MDKNVYGGLMYLAKHARLNDYEMNEFRDIICDHDFENWNDGYGNDWDKCKHCNRLQVKEKDLEI